MSLRHRTACIEEEAVHIEDEAVQRGRSRERRMETGPPLHRMWGGGTIRLSQEGPATEARKKPPRAPHQTKRRSAPVDEGYGMRILDLCQARMLETAKKFGPSSQSRAVPHR